MSGEVAKPWADPAMYISEPMPERGPSVTVLNATPDPLGSLAALVGIYSGKVVRSLRDVTDEDRKQAFEDMGKTALNGALEVVSFHFLLEGVTRSFTHQLVRGRHAFYAQESLRFAIPEESWTERVARPPSLDRDPEPLRTVHPLFSDEENREYALKMDLWKDAIIAAQNSYDHLIAGGIPAEDARGLIPHAMTTRVHWVVSLRELLHVAGLRLCTQAQFEWRTVMSLLRKSLRDFSYWDDNWQFEFLADKLAPICYQTGRCAFDASFDRKCAIRERVSFRNKHGARDSSQWHKQFIADKVVYDPKTGLPFVASENSLGISPAEWLADPGAAR